MRKSSFLSKLKKKGILGLVEPSGEICASYLEKAGNCLRSARLLLENGLYENSTSMSYYAMYSSLTALLFKIGIKCESHAGSILLLKELLGKTGLFKTASFAKKERIDRQYYVTSEKNPSVIRDSAADMLLKAEGFLVKMKLIIKNLGNDETEKLRAKFDGLG